MLLTQHSNLTPFNSPSPQMWRGGYRGRGLSKVIHLSGAGTSPSGRQSLGYMDHAKQEKKIMAKYEVKYRVVLIKEAVELLKEHFIATLLSDDEVFGYCFECVSIDSTAQYLSLDVLATEDIVISIQIPHRYVLYILGGDYKQIGFLRKRKE